MTNHADPWGLPVLPSLSGRIAHRTSIERTGGPERIYDAANADPDWKPTPVGFAPPAPTSAPVAEPLLWEGD